jgi:hypothetical protein
MACVIYIDVYGYFIFMSIDFFWFKFDELCGAFVHADYFCVDYSRIDSATPWFVSTEACHARGLAVTHLRTQHRSGARHRALSGIDSVCIDLDRADHVAPNKS